jgi:polar amino acid transport system substrate-binding protein
VTRREIERGPGLARCARLALLVLSVAALTLAACGEDDSASGEGEGSSNKLASMVPAEVRDAGVLRVATSLDYPPFDFQSEGGEPTGVDVETITAIAERLDLEADFTNMAFASIIPAVKSGRFDVGMNGIYDLPEREREVTFVNYYQAANVLLVPKGNARQISVDDMCGTAVALAAGSAEIKIVDGLSEDCTSEGEPAIDRRIFPDTAAQLLALRSERADSVVTEFATANYLVETEKRYEVASGVIPGGPPAGFVVNRENQELAKALQAGLQSTMDDGTFQKIMAKYGLKSRAFDKAQINAG